MATSDTQCQAGAASAINTHCNPDNQSETRTGQSSVSHQFFAGAARDAQGSTRGDAARVVLAVSGWRGLKGDYSRQRVEGALVRFVLTHGLPHEVVTGGAAGADRIAEAWARRRGIHVTTIRPARCSKKTAEEARTECLSRNTVIVERCTHLLAFPSSSGSGTQDTIRKAVRSGKIVTVVKV